MRTVGQADRGRTAADLFHRDRVLEIAEACAAVFFFHCQAQKTELTKRKRAWKPRQHDYQSGGLWKYAQTVGTARDGAVTHPGAKAETHVFGDI